MAERREYYLNPENAKNAVIATNAELTDEDLAVMKSCIGVELELDYSVRQQHSDDDRLDNSFSAKTPFVLVDINYFTTESEDQHYLAFIRSNKNTFFPLLLYIDALNNTEHVQVNQIVKKKDGSIVWNFDRPMKPIKIDVHEPADFVDVIKGNSASLLTSQINSLKHI